MEKILIIQFIFFIFCSLSGLLFLIYHLFKNRVNTDYYEIICLIKKQTANNIKCLQDNNKKIDILERKIRKCKEKLGYKLNYK